jgi:transposase
MHGPRSQFRIRQPATSGRRSCSWLCVAPVTTPFADVKWTQTLPDWIGSHVRAFEFFEGVPEIVVRDNLKSD